MQDKVLELLNTRKFSELKVLLSEENPADIVAYLENIPQNELILVFEFDFFNKFDCFLGKFILLCQIGKIISEFSFVFGITYLTEHNVAYN